MSAETDWHRHWKPGLQGKPWQTFVVNTNTFLVKSYFHDGSYELLLSDCKVLWREDLDTDSIKKRTKELNPSFEAPVSKLLDHIQSLVDEQRKGSEYAVTIETTEEGQTKAHLTVTSKLAGLPFTWKFIGSPVDKKMLADHLTMPLLVMVGELDRRKLELQKMLAAKDREIDDLRAQGVRASRRHIETTPFDETAFLHNMETSKGFEDQVSHLGVASFSLRLQRLYERIMTKHAWLHREVPEDAEGESLLNEDGESELAGTATVPGQSWTNRLPPSIAQSGSTSQSVASKSPKTSPTKSPQKGKRSAEPSPLKDTELLRREALERRLREEETKKEQKAKKKKKIQF